MKNKQVKTVKTLSITAFVFVLLGVLGIIQTMSRGLNGSTPFGEESAYIQKGWYIIYGISGLAVIILFLFWIINTWLGIKRGNIFPRVNVGISYLCGFIYIIYSFCDSNILHASQTGNFSVIILESNTIAIPLVIFILATLYKIASITSEENNLTI